MGYQALLFCPDEKTARTVTQVLSELDFNVESCTEPFAAVKKLMSQHFDAVVVDCDNEQNATLLFKSARNSTPNQASLAVAVVEGQAGVAKAFRIGANLVLTKPINIEQAKGTLRVARGLLRKGEPAKPGAAAMAASPAITGASKSAPPARLETPVAPVASTTSARTKPEPTQAWPAPVPAALSKSSEPDEDLLGISGEDSVAAVAPAPPAANKFITPSPQSDKFLAAAVASPSADLKTSNSGSPATFGTGAASAPAPARELPGTRRVEPSPVHSTDVDARLKTVEAGHSEASTLVGAAPTFTFGGANAPAESSGGSGKKLLLAVAAIVIVTALGYAGWTRSQGHASEPGSPTAGTIPAPVASLPTAKPSLGKPSPSPSTAKTPESLQSSPSAAPTAKGHTADSTDSAFEGDAAPAPSSTKSSSSTSSPTSKVADEPEAREAPLVVKGGKAPAVRAKTGVSDVAAPNMNEIASAGASAPPPDLGGGSAIAPKPLLQTLNISQGVSRGLLYKKVQPIYPRGALSMRVEGTVELMATISKNGDISHVKVLSGDSQLTKAATEAVKQWKYKPYLLNGEPVEIQTQVTINFKLPK